VGVLEEVHEGGFQGSSKSFQAVHRGIPRVFSKGSTWGSFRVHTGFQVGFSCWAHNGKVHGDSRMSIDGSLEDREGSLQGEFQGRFPGVIAWDQLKVGPNSGCYL